MTAESLAAFRRGISHPDSSVRMRAAMAIGTYPDDAAVDALVDRCSVEPDLFVRETLTWALMRHCADVVVPRLLEVLRSDLPQARSQALHTLSKIRDRRAWPAVSGALLHDPHDEVARTAWRAAVALVPEGGEQRLAAELVQEFGRGDPDLQRALSRALVALGEPVRPLLVAAEADAHPAVRLHAIATRLLLDDPEGDFLVALDDAGRVVILGAGTDSRSSD